MKKIILATAAFLFASGMAFAGSDHFGSDFVPAASAYPNTGSHSMASDGAVDMSVTDSTTDGDATSGMPAPGYGQGIWGR
jgi:hypothetical protein